MAVVNLELKRLGKQEIREKNIKKISSLIENSKLPFNDIESALISIAKKDTTRNSVIKIICPDVSYSDNKVFTKTVSKKKVIFEIGSGFAYRLAQCCKPKINSSIIGYITKQKSITVHTKKCHEISKLDAKRIISAKWE
jgi:(p)ppGpp synthase/HD superfamily hydrolase